MATGDLSSEVEKLLKNGNPYIRKKVRCGGVSRCYAHLTCAVAGQAALCAIRIIRKVQILSLIKRVCDNTPS